MRRTGEGGGGWREGGLEHMDRRRKERRWMGGDQRTRGEGETGYKWEGDRVGESRSKGGMKCGRCIEVKMKKVEGREESGAQGGWG